MIGKQHIAGAGLCEHLRLGDGGALEPGDAGLELELDDLAEFVCLDVGAQSVGCAGHRDHAPDIFHDAIGIN